MWSTFRCWIGSMTVGEMRSSSSGMPASAFSALSSAADEAPSSADVLPVTMRPSPSSIAVAGSPVRSATASAAGTVFRMEGSMDSERISSLSLSISASEASPSRRRQAVL